MRLRNHTDIDDDLVRRVIAFVRPPGIAHFDLVLGNTRHAQECGSALTHGRRCGGRLRQHVQIRMPRSPRLGERPGHGAYLPWPPRTREEGLVLIVAHELRHLWQKRVRRGRRVWGARGQYSERDADAYALRALRHWRRGEPMP